MAPATSVRDTFCCSSVAFVEGIVLADIITILGNCGELTICVLCGVAITLCLALFGGIGSFCIVRICSVGLENMAHDELHICCIACPISSGVVAVTTMDRPFRETILTGQGHPKRQDKNNSSALLGERDGISGIGRPNSLHSFRIDGQYVSK